MTSDTPTIREFIQNSSTFDTIAEDYRDDADCYNNLRNETKKNLLSFDKYLEFYATNIKYVPTKYVLSDLEQNAVRSLKI